MRAVGYCRVSTTEQASGYSLEVQESELRAHCVRMGWTLDRVFIEPGSSAKTDKRPKFLELLEYCRKNQDAIDVVLVHKLDRFMRSVYHHAHTRYLLSTYGITVASVTEPGIGDDPSGKALEGMLSVFAQFDNDVRSVRTVSGMKARLESGHWCWKAPRGYTQEMGHDPIEGPRVQKLFSDFASGAYSNTDLRKRFGISRTALHKMLRNPIYRGRIVVDKWGIDVAGAFTPLIDEETWYRVQRALDGRQPSVKSAPVFDLPLKGFVTCPCGVPLTGALKKGRYRYYMSQPRCGCRQNVNAENLEEKFTDLLRCVQPKPGLVKAFNATVLDVYRQMEQEAQAAEKQLTWRLKGVEKKKSQLVEAHVYEKTIDAATLKEMMDRLRHEETVIKLERYDAELDGLDVSAVLAFAERTLSDLPGSWNRASTQQKQRLQRVIFPDGVTWDGESVGTHSTARFFKWIAPLSGGLSPLASPGGFEPPLPA